MGPDTLSLLEFQPHRAVSSPLLLSTVFPPLLSLLFHPDPFREDKYTPYDTANFIKGEQERGSHMTDTWVGIGESWRQADGGHTRLNMFSNGCPGVLILITRQENKSVLSELFI